MTGIKYAELGELKGVADVQRFAELLEPAYGIRRWYWFTGLFPGRQMIAATIRRLETAFTQDDVERNECGGLCLERRDGRLFLLADRKLAELVTGKI